jgi:peptidoglycan/LPS O-acetylase OafA/YrhL
VTDRADDDRSAAPGVPSSFRGEEPGQVAQYERTAGPTRPDDPASGAGAMPDPDAPHEEPNLSYIPALDGMRAFAVLGVMAFHGGIPWLVGGYLGVDAFFVLSGFLITSLLVNEWHRLRTIRLGAFWARRARRLLPALLLVLLFVACYAAFIVPRGTYPNLRLDSLSTLFYVANWHFILIGSSYFNQTGLPSPLTHTWSLAIEEQFYLIWPLVVLGLLKLTRNLRVLLVVSVVGALASAVEMALLYHPGVNTTRLYYGTDTHAQCLLVGASLAVSLAIIARERSRRPAVPGSRARRGRPPGGDPRWAATTPAGRTVFTVVGLVGVAGSAVLWSRLTGNDALLYRGGFLLAALATAAVLVSVVCAQRSPVAVALSVAPLRYLGRISYGMYLWHYPLFIWIDGTRTGLSGYSLFGVRAAATIAVATVSFYLVERPIRQGSFFRQWRAWLAAPVAVVVTVVALVVATTVPAVAGAGLATTTTTVPAADAGRPVKVLVIGDSTALTLAINLGVDAKAYGLTVKDEGIVGCGVTEGTLDKTTGVVGNVWNACNSRVAPGTPLFQYTPAYGHEIRSPDAEQWTVWDRDWIDQYDPDVVVLLAGRWEVHTRVYDGQWTNITEPDFAAYVKRQLAYTVGFASAKGAKVVLLTAPCYDHGEQPNGQPWPTDTPARLDAYNRLVDEVAAENPTKATAVNLDAMVCPSGQFEQDIDGVQVRSADGVHFPGTGAAAPYLDPKILPVLERIGREQMTSR